MLLSMVAALRLGSFRLQRGIMRPNIRKVDGRHRFCFGAVQSRLYSTADMGKRAAREKAKNEVRLRNIRYREASSAARGDAASTLYSLKVSVCPVLREELNLNGREKRGRVFVESDSFASSSLQGLKNELHAFFRALRKSTYLLSAQLPQVNEDGEMVLDNEMIGGGKLELDVSSDEDVANLFKEAVNFYEARQNIGGAEAITRPTVLLHVSKDPNAPAPPPPPAYLDNMPDPTTSEHMTMLSFYSFPPSQIQDVDEFCLNLRRAWKPFGALGRIYVAKEGVNAQMSVPTNVMSNYRECCFAIPELGEYMENGLNIDPVPIPSKEFFHGENPPPFKNLHIRPKSQIVADGLDKPLDWQRAGNDLPPLEWHKKLQADEPPILLDCRNSYETGVGKFVNAEPLGTDTFRDSWEILKDRLKDVPRDKEVMTYCTGGIRCVKVGAYLEQELGFKNVSRLAGGIIAYDRTLEKEREKNPQEAEELSSLFHGTNYVFDGRVGRQITDHKLGECVTCGNMTNLLGNCANTACHKRMVQCSACLTGFDGCCSTSCQTRFVNSLAKSKRSLSSGVEREGGGVTKSSSGEIDFDPSVFDDVQEYSAEHSSEAPELYDAIQRNTERYLPTGAHMTSGGVQGRLLASLASMARSGRVLEVGTFTGYATCAFAEGVGAGGGGGLVLTLERDKLAVGVARHHIRALSKGTGADGWKFVGELDNKTVAELGEGEEFAVSLEDLGGVQVVSRRCNDALAVLEEMAADGGGLGLGLGEEPFDLVFVDADKTRLLDYVEVCLASDKVLRKGGAILVDNVLWKGAVIAAGDGNEDGGGDGDGGGVETKQTRRKRKLARIMHHFNERIKTDSRAEVVLLPLRDGLSIIRKR
ncbi:hypothetical protein TrVE_jg12588 [Triparma verrucosa]|uniref:Rhodanese domain-containing protein n=1 Tax=Triparma verrucosa TaxID=1606542 RepID=A0A9W7FIW4_9STRA|nr:hypothetical protein TrVE_jg12588 [Triparma verrucosa]